MKPLGLMGARIDATNGQFAPLVIHGSQLRAIDYQLPVPSAQVKSCILLAGLYAGSRQFWFVGTNARGQVTLYRGIPYELPLGVKLYSQQYVSAVPAGAITDRRQRSADLDQQWRSKGDARDLVNSLERQYAHP